MQNRISLQTFTTLVVMANKREKNVEFIKQQDEKELSYPSRRHKNHALIVAFESHCFWKKETEVDGIKYILSTLKAKYSTKFPRPKPPIVIRCPITILEELNTSSPK